MHDAPQVRAFRGVSPSLAAELLNKAGVDPRKVSNVLRNLVSEKERQIRFDVFTSDTIHLL
jgi:hypothetical protein